MQTISRSELTTLRMASGNEKRISCVIDGDDVKEWVGIGWITDRKATKADRETIPVILESNA